MKFKTHRNKPTRVEFNTKNLKKGFLYYAKRDKYPTIELKGESIESFDRVSKLKEIILLGEDGEVRRIILK